MAKIVPKRQNTAKNMKTAKATGVAEIAVAAESASVVMSTMVGQTKVAKGQCKNKFYLAKKIETIRTMYLKEATSSPIRVNGKPKRQWKTQVTHDLTLIASEVDTWLKQWEELIADVDFGPRKSDGGHRHGFPAAADCLLLVAQNGTGYDKKLAEGVAMLDSRLAEAIDRTHVRIAIIVTTAVSLNEFRAVLIDGGPFYG